MDPNYYKALFEQLLQGNLSPEETEDLVNWLGNEESKPQASDLILAQLSQTISEEQITPELRKLLESKLPSILSQSASTTVVRTIPFFKRQWIRYAAAIIIILGTSLFIWLPRKSSLPAGPSITHAPVKNDVAPGKEGAILTLEDGRKVVLDDLGNGVVATQNGTKVLLNDGQLVYNTGDAASKEIVYNTIATPRGRQFQLVLPDQTKVWLNAASSLRYPIAFTGKERKVEITGEAYFEVTKNAQMPFHVKINDETEVEVLGTHFNINSYSNEANVNTTLLEGSVKISHKGEKAVIKPGQQAQVSMQSQNKIRVLSDVNVEKVMAWKNGVFDFQDATLEEVMHQLERWYDIEVKYEKGIPKLEFVGKMGRDLNLSSVLRGLELSKVHCRLEGKTLTILP